MGYIEDMRARIGHDMLITASVAVLVSDGRRILLQRRGDNGLWALHGGMIEIGETFEDAARRELREELGYAASEEEMRFVARLRRSNSYCYVYALNTNRRENDFSLQKEEVSAVRWCSPQRLMQMVAEGSMYNYGDAYYKLLLEFQRNNMRA